MTGGIVIVLDERDATSRRMSGGIAYVLDDDGTFATRCNRELVGFDPSRATPTIECSSPSTWPDGLDGRRRVLANPCDLDPVRGDATRPQAGVSTSRSTRRPSVSTGGGGFFTAETEEEAR
jgi:hypothetical protein